MARFVPELEGRVFVSAAERKIAKRFRAELDDETVVLHSVGLVRHATKRWAEADFVVVGPNGVFCLEVKGGRVARRDGMWTFTDRDDRETLKFEGPFEQAGGAAGALAAYLRDHLPRAASLPVQGFGVITPDCVLDLHDPGVDRAVLYDQRDTGELMSAYLRRLGEHWSARAGGEPLSAELVALVVNAVRGDFEATVVRSARTDRIEEELIRFTDEQRRLLAALASNDRVLVQGPAGTGKTLLALNEAERLAAAGSSVLLVCSGDGLAADLAARVPASVSVVPMSELSALTGRFGAVIVDEGQDLLAEAMLRSLGEHVDGGWTGGCWRFFFDPNQDLLGRPADGEWELLEAASPAVVRLSMNCRNTQRIIELTALLSGASDLAASEVIGPVVTVCSDWDLPHRERVRRQLDRLATSGVPAGEVVVLVTDTLAQHELAEALGLTVAAVAHGETRCLTISEFKGRESPVVVLAGPAALGDEAGRRLAYVGASRARVELVAVLPADAAESYVERLADYAERLAQRAQGGAGR